MKARLLLLLALFTINSGTALSQTPPPKTEPATTTQESQSEGTPTKFQKFTENLQEIDTLSTSIVLITAKFVVLLLSFLVVCRLMGLIASRSSQLVIDNFTNATGAEELESILPGLSQLARERLLREMKVVQQRVQEHIERVAPNTYRPTDQIPLPSSTPDQRLAELVNSLEDITPEQIDPLVQLLAIIFPPYGTKVTAMLQSQGEAYEKIGISFEIIDIQGHHASKLYTIWESPKEETLNSSLKERYRLLLRTANRWLAIELSRREMIAPIPWFYFGKKRNHYQAQIHNFFGVLNQASAQTHGKLFYRLAIDDLKESIKLEPNWYKSYDNLAETYSLLGRGEKGDKKNYYLKSAITFYNDAFKKVADPIIQQRIKVGSAIAKLLTQEENLIQEAKQEMQNLASNLDATTIVNHRLLYHLACWYAIASGLGILEEGEKKARRYLAYSLVRETNHDFWEWTGKDPDLEGIRENFTELKGLLSKKLDEVPELSKFAGEKFSQPITEILRQVNWL